MDTFVLKNERKRLMIINDIKNTPALSAGAAVKYGFAAMRFNSSAVMKVFMLIIIPICILNAYLTGTVATDYSYASGSGIYNLSDASYMEEYAQAAQVDIDKFPEKGHAV